MILKTFFFNLQRSTSLHWLNGIALDLRSKGLKDVSYCVSGQETLSSLKSIGST